MTNNSTPGSYAEHQRLLNKWEIAVTKLDPRIITLPYTVGTFRDIDTAERIIKVGQKGVLDNLLILPNGKVLFFDAKTGKYLRFSREQKDFCVRLDETCGYQAAHKLTSVDSGLKILEKYL